MRGWCSILSKERDLARYRTGIFVASAEEDIVGIVLPTLQKRFPNVAFSFLVPWVHAELFSVTPNVLWMEDVKAHPVRWLLALRKRKFDLCIVIFANRPTYLKTKLAALLLNPKRIVAYTEAGNLVVVDRAGWWLLFKRAIQGSWLNSLLFPVGLIYLMGRTLWLVTRSGFRSVVARVERHFS